MRPEGGHHQKISAEQRLAKLTEPKTAKMKERDQIRNQKELEEIRKHCTFQPKLKRSSSTVRHETIDDSAQYINRQSRFDGFGRNQKVRPGSAVGRESSMQRLPI